MYYLKSEASFDAAHFLKGYEGKCSNIHGHRWRVEVEIEGEKLSEETQTRGMLVDFSDLKKAIKELCDKFDHTFIYEEGSLKDATVKALMEEDFKMNVVAFRPTAENFAKFFYDRLAASGFDVHRVLVYETPNNCACYEG